MYDLAEVAVNNNRLGGQLFKRYATWVLAAAHALWHDGYHWLRCSIVALKFSYHKRRAHDPDVNCSDLKYVEHSGRVALVQL